MTEFDEDHKYYFKWIDDSDTASHISYKNVKIKVDYKPKRKRINVENQTIELIQSKTKINKKL